MSPTKQLPSIDELQARYRAACELKQPVNRELIAAAFMRWAERVIKTPVTIRFAGSAATAKRAARAARAAWAAREAREAREAWAATWDCSWIAVTSIGALSRADEGTFLDWLPILEAFEAGAFCFWVLPTEIVVAELPTRVSVDNRRRLHSEGGPAFSWLQDIRDYYWHGVYVPGVIVDEPSKITVKMIEKEQNAEVRRVLIERYGMARYLLDSGAEVVDRDDFGTLLRKQMPVGHAILMVKVVNSTQEPDGTFKDYFLRVHPELRPLPPAHWPDNKKIEWLEKQEPQELTARNAVASTWGLRGEAYNPKIET